MKRTLTILAATTALAAPLQAETLSVVGSWSGLPLHIRYEAPFWSEILPAASGGALEVALTTHNQMNLGLGDIYPLLGQGVYDVAMTVADYAVADAPELEGLDVPMLAMTADEARAMVDAARPMVADIFAARFNSHVLAIAPYPPQIVFCNRPITGLDDLRGLKVRGSGRMTQIFLEALGAESVSVGFGEVPGALQRGVIDCGVTGGGSGYSAGWWEVSTHLMPIPLGGWDSVVTAINLDRWNSLSPELQELIATRIAEDFEAPVWASAEGALANDIACLTGNGACASGDARNMILVEVSDEDMARARDVVVNQVLPDWAARCEAGFAGCTALWNDTIGKARGLTIQ
ncbi:MAG: TRAP transporter substrate-binding protein [Gemmobacter sp.]